MNVAPEHVGSTASMATSCVCHDKVLLGVTSQDGKLALALAFVSAVHLGVCVCVCGRTGRWMYFRMFIKRASVVCCGLFPE